MLGDLVGFVEQSPTLSTDCDVGTWLAGYSGVQPHLLSTMEGLCFPGVNEVDLFLRL